MNSGYGPPMNTDRPRPAQVVLVDNDPDVLRLLTESSCRVPMPAGRAAS